MPVVECGAGFPNLAGAFQDIWKTDLRCCSTAPGFPPFPHMSRYSLCITRAICGERVPDLVNSAFSLLPLSTANLSSTLSTCPADISEKPDTKIYTSGSIAVMLARSSRFEIL